MSGFCLLFCGSYYYPLGGWEDFGGEFETVEAAQEASPPSEYDWAHIVDSEAGAVIWRREGLGPWKVEANLA